VIDVDDKLKNLEKVSIDSLMLSETMKDMLNDLGVVDGKMENFKELVIPLSNVKSEILGKIVTYCDYHVKNKTQPSKNEDKVTDDIIPWDLEFCKVDQATLFELILASNYLNIKSLLDLTCKTVANMIKGKSPEEIRKTFNIKNDFTPEEEEKVRKENEWCEER